MLNFERTFVFIAAFLLFWLELLLADIFLSKFGGSYHVWLVSLAYFTFSLFCSYLWVKFFAHLGRARELIISFYVLFTLTIFSFFNFVTPKDFHPTNLNIESILFGITITIGLPFFLLGLTTPLMQYLSSRTKGKNQQNNSLFACSNWGSILGLILPTFCFGPLISLSLQFIIWKILFIIHGCFISVFLFQFLKSYFVKEDFLFNINPLWIFYSFLTCTLMLSVTNFISFGIGSAPLTWIIPLLIFLSTFAIVFGEIKISDSIIQRLVYLWLFIFLISLTGHSSYCHWFGVLSYYLFLFIITLIINKALYLIRPENPFHITSFNLSLNMGGLLGTFFIAFGGPYLGRSFSNVYAELFYSIFLCAVFFGIRDRKKNKLTLINFSNKKKLLLIFSSLALFFIVIFSFYDFSKNNIAYVRNFYGINHISLQNGIKLIINGRTVHGGQFIEKKKNIFPLFYYHPKSPVGLLFSKLETLKEVGAIGLGAGSLSYYSRPGEHWTFFELDSAVLSLAQKHFSFLKNAKGKIDFEIGDGRLNIQKYKGRFDLIIIDAFSNDFVPRHLITKEAFQIYLEHLNNKGTIILNISNSFLKLQTVLIPLAKHFDLSYAFLEKSFTDELGGSDSCWFILSLNKKLIEELIVHDKWKTSSFSASLWTDDYMNIFIPLLKSP